MGGSIYTIPITSITVLALTTLLQAIAVGAPGWSGTKEIYYGLWQYCGTSPLNPSGGCTNIEHLRQFASVGGDSLNSVRAMECLTLLTYVVSLACGIMFISKKDDGWRLGLAFFAVLGGSLALIGVVIFSSENSDMYYSFAIAAMAALLTFITAGLMLVRAPTCKQQDVHIQIK